MGHGVGHEVSHGVGHGVGHVVGYGGGHGVVLGFLSWGREVSRIVHNRLN